MDRLSQLLGRHCFSAKVFYNGEFCGSNGFDEEGKSGHLHIVRRGLITMNHEDRPALHIEEPSIVLYMRGLNHQLCVPAESPAKLLCARIAFEDGMQNPLTKALPDCLEIPLKNMLHVTSLLDMLFKEADMVYPGQQMTLDRLCDVVVVQVVRYAFETGQLAENTLSGLADKGLTRALVMMHNDPGHPWSLEKLADACGMSRSRFAKLFHEVVAMTPGEYLTERRMLLAQRLLKKKRPIKAVAVEVGYGSQPAFTKAFTARLGMSPRDWLKNTA